MSIEFDMARLMTDMRNLRAEAMRQDVLPKDDLIKGAAPGQDSSFGNLFKDAINQVNEIQQQSGDLKLAYEKGDPGVDITQVMVAGARSEIATTFLLQTRNKMVDAYRDIMNMPI